MITQEEYAAACLDEQPDYHDEIMKLAVTKAVPDIRREAAYNIETGYAIGHHDARHAAAEIANEADTRIAELEAENERLKEERVGDNHWIIDLQQIRGRLEAQLAAAEQNTQYFKGMAEQYAEARNAAEAQLAAAKDVAEAYYVELQDAEARTREIEALKSQLAEAERLKAKADVHIGVLELQLTAANQATECVFTEYDAMKLRAEQAEARAQEAVSILADMHDREDERCRFHGAQGQDVGCLACIAQDALQPAGDVKPIHCGHCAKLHGVLQKVEWVPIRPSRHSHRACPWCSSKERDGHKPDCARQDALQPAPDTKQLNTVGDALALVNEATQEEIRQCAPGESLNEYRKRMAPQPAKENCAECGKYPADWPSKICQGCAAYREHTAI